MIPRARREGGDHRGSASSSIVRMRWGIARATSETPPRWRKALMRKRATPGMSCERSISFSTSNSACARCLPSNWCSASSCQRFEHRPAVLGERPELAVDASERHRSTFRCRSDPSHATSAHNAWSYLSRASSRGVGSDWHSVPVLDVLAIAAMACRHSSRRPTVFVSTGTLVL